jgi:ATP-dependent RNA helicase DeaD
MTGTDLTQLVGPALASALAAKGYDTLTPVQEAVLDDALGGRDLRITSQTGSGKTIAIGFAVRDLLDDLTAQGGGLAKPRVLILAPTRELAKQVADELTWLYAPLRIRVAAVTGGSGYLDQKRALASNPAVLVATPGRLRDTLERGRIDVSALAAVVLDEADSMLDLGFREDLEAILAKLPAERRSHLVSATFSRDVVALADRFQKEPVHVQGTRLGEANSDIEHVVHLVAPPQRVDALINLLLSDEDAKSLVFVRTRADVARIAGELAEAGFVVRTLSGEMEQPERDRALAAFRQGGVQALVATDVAARGIDVRDIARVIQLEPPTDVETYTHRSGRTGRAGKQGISVLFVAPSHYPTIARGLARAKISHRVEPIPRPDAIQRAREEKLVAWLAREGDGETIDPHALSIAERVMNSGSVVTAVARLIEKAGLHGPTKAREVRVIPPPRDDFAPRGRDGQAPRGPREVYARTSRDAQARGRDGEAPRRPQDGPAARASEGPPGRAYEASPGRGYERAERAPRGGEGDTAPGWVTFRVTWGSLHGADPRRLLAVACRRGDIRGSDVGAIRVEGAYSLLDVTRDVADGFETQAARPDPRDPRVRITRADKALPEDERTDVPSVPPPGAQSHQGPPRQQSDAPPPRHTGPPRHVDPRHAGHAGPGGSPRYAGPPGRNSGPPRHADSSARPPSRNGASRPDKHDKHDKAEKPDRPEGAPPPAKFETPKRRRVVGAEPPVRKRSKG